MTDQKLSVAARAAEWIAGAERPVSFSGAGLSAESGIATFRGDDDSLWSRYDPVQLASEQGFLANRPLVMDWYAARRRALSKAVPNAAHRSLARQSGWTHITQNVDHLLEVAGAGGESVLHLHGSLLKDHCNAGCGYADDVDLANPPLVRACPRCGGYLRPSVVWFGEALPEHTWASAMAAVKQCDALLVVGTSAEVYPAAGLIEVARQGGARVVVVNTDDGTAVAGRDVFLQGGAADIVPQLLG